MTPGRHYPPSMQLACLVVSHRNPPQVLRLVRALTETGSSTAFVRHDPRHSRLDPGELREAGGHLLTDDVEVEWGTWSHLEMLLGALGRVAAEADPDWLVVLSGQDYPLRPVSEVEQRLAASDDDALLASAWELDTTRMPPAPAEEFFLRYAYLHLPVPSRTPYLPGRLKRLAYVRDRPPRLGLRRRKLPFGDDLRCWVSGDWPTLNRRSLRTVLQTARGDRRLVRHYRRTVSPAESFLATALANDPELRISGDHRRFARFAPGAPSPDVLTTADVEQLRACGAEFARKFDTEVDGRVLDLLDEARRAQGPR